MIQYDSETYFVKRVGNQVFFYSEITNETVGILNSVLAEAAQALAKFPPKKRKRGRIVLRIDSKGGSLYDAFATVDYIRGMPFPVDTIIEGSCLSAATLISLAGKKRMIGKNSFMLIHQLSQSFSGTLGQMQGELTNCEQLNRKMLKYYLDNSNLSKRKLKSLLEQDLYLDAKTCLKYGLVDKVI